MVETAALPAERLALVERAELELGELAGLDELEAERAEPVERGAPVGDARVVIEIEPVVPEPVEALPPAWGP